MFVGLKGSKPSKTNLSVSPLPLALFQNINGTKHPNKADIKRGKQFQAFP
jgi:hypothetical protein